MSQTLYQHRILGHYCFPHFFCLGKLARLLCYISILVAVNSYSLSLKVMGSNSPPGHSQIISALMERCMVRVVEVLGRNKNRLHFQADFILQVLKDNARKSRVSWPALLPQSTLEYTEPLIYPIRHLWPLSLCELMSAFAYITVSELNVLFLGHAVNPNWG